MWGEIIDSEIEPESTSVGERRSGEAGLTSTLKYSIACTPPESKGSSNVNKVCSSSDPNAAQNPEKSCEHPTCLNDMIAAVAISNSPVKSQQIGEPELSLVERKQILLELYNSKPLVFLERYQAHLKPEHLEAFSHVSSDFRYEHYCKEVQRRAGNQAKRTSVRNHRYAALRALQKGKHFTTF